MNGSKLLKVNLLNSLKLPKSSLTPRLLKLKPENLLMLKKSSKRLPWKEMLKKRESREIERTLNKKSEISKAPLLKIMSTKQNWKNKSRLPNHKKTS